MSRRASALDCMAGPDTWKRHAGLLSHGSRINTHTPTAAATDATLTNVVVQFDAELQAKERTNPQDDASFVIPN